MALTSSGKINHRFCHASAAACSRRTTIKMTEEHQSFFRVFRYFCFALLREFLLAIAPKGTKKSCPASGPGFAGVRSLRRQEAERRRCAGRRARSEGTGTSLRDGPRSSAGGRGVLRSKTRMSGWPSLWLLSLGQARESDSPSRAKPESSGDSAIGVYSMQQAPRPELI